ncbi:hypothetical protein [Croceiramulus getboli]|nr:hypothetical protein P8624_09665 [Flavobacteriaceae bacterium YJPT1-3]
MKKWMYIFIVLCVGLACSSDDSNTKARLSDSKEIISFQFLAAENPSTIPIDIEGTINEDEITLLVPHRAMVSFIFPSIEVSDRASYSPQGPQDFNAPLTYTVTAEDGSTADYTVTVEENRSARPLSEIVNYFRFLAEENPVDTDIEGTIIDGEDKIIMTVPIGTPVTNLIARIGTTDIDGTVGDFALPASDYTNGQVFGFFEQDGTSIFIIIEIEFE